MEAAGFVLAGGRSSRMGRDKAELEVGGVTLVARGLASLKTVCAEVAIAGGDERLARFGRVVRDETPDCGPLGGIVAALEQSAWEWNLFLAVDVPFVPEAVWRGLLLRAAEGGAICVMARGKYVQPLIAAYAKSAVGVLRKELEAGRWKMTAAIAAAGGVAYVDFADESWFSNVNTPEEFAALTASKR